MNVPLLDLKAQYRPLKKELDEVLIKVAESQYFILGKEVEEMEKEMAAYLGAKYAIGVSSGTDALLLALMGLGIQPGDEVILPTYSFFATAGVVSRLNAVPVFADNDPVTFNIAPAEIEKKITPKTKAIIPVHLYGQSADMDPIMEIAQKHNLFVVEDAAQAIGVQYKDGKRVGTIGHIGCFSFFPSKNLGCFGDGGLVTTNDPELYEKLYIMRVHGGKPKYYHRIIGGNFRIDAIQAAVLRVKLPHLNDWSAARRTNAARYIEFFRQAGLSTQTGVTEFSETETVLLPKAVYEPVEGLTDYHIYNQFIIRVQKRDELKDFLLKNNIGVEIYYPVPFHRQDCFAYLNTADADYPNSNYSAEYSLALPIYPELTEEMQKYVVDTIAAFYKKDA